MGVIERKYSIPAAMSSSVRQVGGSRTQIPGGIRVSHSELVATFTSTTAFTPVRLQIQPSLQTFSPWLAAQAADYDQYRLVRLEAEYRPSCGTDNSGSVMMTFDYDPSDRIPVSEQTMSTYMGATEAAPWLPQRTAMDAAAVHATGPRKYLRTGPVAGDLRTYDSGQFFFATQDGPAVPILWGKLWFHYTFDLLVQTSPINPTATQVFSFASVNAQTIGAGGFLNGSFPTALSNFANAFTLDAPTSTLITCPAGVFLVVLSGGLVLNADQAVRSSVQVVLQVNAINLTLQTIPFSSGAGTAGEGGALNLIFPIVTNAGDTVRIAFQNFSTQSVNVLLPCVITFLSV